MVPEKLTGTPISGGDYASYAKSNAFDGNTGTIWYSPQVYSDGNGVAYIGLLLSSAVSVSRFRIFSYLNNPEVISLRYSNDGSNWITIKTFNFSSNSNIWNEFEVEPHSECGLYVALFCDIARVVGGSSFSAYEVEFYGQKVNSSFSTPAILSCLPASLARGFW